MQQINSILPKVLDEYKLKDESKSSHILFQFQKTIAEVLRVELDELKGSVLPLRYDKQIIYIEVKNTAWAQKIQLLKAEVIEKINASSKEYSVQDLKISL